MKKPRKHYSGEEKVAILRRHLLEQEPVSKFRNEFGLQPTAICRWQKEFLENGAAAFQAKARSDRQAEQCHRRSGGGYDHRDTWRGDSRPPPPPAFAGRPPGRLVQFSGTGHAPFPPGRNCDTQTALARRRGGDSNSSAPRVAPPRRLRPRCFAPAGRHCGRYPRTPSSTRRQANRSHGVASGS